MAEVARRIVEYGADAAWDGAPTRELALSDALVRAPGSRRRVDRRARRPGISAVDARELLRPEDRAGARRRGELRRAALHDEGGGRDQVAWVVERLRANPECRDATITTFQPHTDTTYIPCVSVLDFWLRDGAVELIVYAHSLDFGNKAYGTSSNWRRCRRTSRPSSRATMGALVLHAKTAHVYDPELEPMASLALLPGVRHRNGVIYRCYFKRASSVISGTPASAFETGQFAFAPSAAA